MPADAEARIILKGIDDGASDKVREVRSEVESFTETTSKSTEQINAQNLAFIQQAMALNQVQGGMSMVTGAVIQLNLVSEEQAELLRNITAGMQLFVGTAQMLQGVIGLINALKASEAALAAIQAFRTALIPFIGPILVGAALATTAFVAAKLAGYQTAPGEYRTVRETGPAVVHEGEIISRPGPTRTGRPYGNVQVSINAGALTNLGSYSQRRHLGKIIAKELS